MNNFVHLHGHTEYSLLDGLCKIPDLVKHVKALGMNALAITDHGTMFGVIEFYKMCDKYDVKPIIGCEVYVATRSRHDKEVGRDQDRNHLILLAQDNTGYKNLIKLVTAAHLDGYYYKPRIDREILEKYQEGLIALSGCLASEIPDAIRQDNYERAISIGRYYRELFGTDRFFLELQRHRIEDLTKVNQGLVRLASDLHLPLVATNDFHYIHPQDAQAHDILLCVQTGKTVQEKNRLTLLESPDFYVRSQQEMEELFRDFPQALENTGKIAQRCNVTIELNKYTYPHFPVPNNETPESYLTKLIAVRVAERYKHREKEVQERIANELDIICKKNYATYFLIVHDLVSWARQQGITVGPGRGSAAGSIISYILGITNVDPLYYGLPFERFLNPFRTSAPDIDLDFADNRRDEVVSYVTRKYGEDRVAQICTFGTMAARQAVRDVGRALGYPYSFPDKIAKLIPFSTQTNYVNIAKAIQLVPELSAMYTSDPETKKLLDLASKLEGVTRHASVHAAGVVISPQPLVEYTPLMREADGQRLVTQYEMHSVGEEGVGLLKMDLLGLSNLTILQTALQVISERNKETTIDLEAIPLDDTKTYQMLSDGETTGVFQLESSGMRRHIKELKPSSVFDLMAMVALFRPGPMNSIPEYIARKHNSRLVRFIDPRVENILERSLGLLVYQDDVLLIAIELAGYDWKEVDKLRKAMGKKIPSEMAAQKEKFITRAVEHGLSAHAASGLWQQVEIFAGYGFNKAHAACYGFLAYQTAYLKANYPVEYMSAVMSAEAHNAEKVAHAIEECKRMGIAVLPPSVNTSQVNFSIEETNEGAGIRFGLSAIKNVGTVAVESLIAARQSGAFSSLSDLVGKVDLRTVNKKTLESLVKSGATREFGTRASQLSSLELLLAAAHNANKHRDRGQISLFGDSEPLNPIQTSADMPEVDKQELLAWEKELLGFYLTEHPLTSLIDSIQQKVDVQIADISEEMNGKAVAIGGIIEQIRRTFTKRGNEEMAFAKIADTMGFIEAVVFPKVFRTSKERWIIGQPVIVHGTVDISEDRRSLIVETVHSIQHAPKMNEDTARNSQSVKDQALVIAIPKGITRTALHQAYQLLKMHPGDNEVALSVDNGEERRVLKIPYSVHPSQELLSSLQQLFGDGSVKI